MTTPHRTGRPNPQPAKPTAPSAAPESADPFVDLDSCDPTPGMTLSALRPDLSGPWGFTVAPLPVDDDDD